VSDRSVTNYNAPPTVAQFMRSEAPFRLIMGPVGSGKSTGNIMEIARRAKMQAPGRDGIRRTRWAVVRNTRQQLKDTTQKTWFEWFPIGVAGGWRETDQTFILRFDDVHAEVMFRPLDTPEDIGRLLSLELTGAFINELRELPLEVVVALRSRCGRYPSRKEVSPTWHGIIADTNPPSKDHWIYQKFEVEQPEGWQIFKQPGGLDPGAENLENLPPTYYQEMMEGADEDFINVHVHARYGRSRAGLPVFEKTFTESFHRNDDLIVVPGAPVIIGMDFGRTPAAAFYQRDVRARVLLQDECVAQNMGLENFIDRMVKPMLSARYPGHRVVVAGDPSGWDKSQINEESCRDILVKAGFIAWRPPTNLIAPRLAAVEKYLKMQQEGKATFLVNGKRCPTILEGFKTGYRYKAKKDGTYEEVPEKNAWSHPLDAVQYGAMAVDVAGDLARMMPRARVVERVNMGAWT
jgi:hypothetical protein